MSPKDPKPAYRCTVCNVGTLSSKQCPRCGRRSTLVLETSVPPRAEKASRATPDLAATPRPAPTPTAAPASAKLKIIAASTVIVVLCAVTALAVSLLWSSADEARRKAGAAPGSPDHTTDTRGAPPAATANRTQTRRVIKLQRARRAPPRQVCGRGYCLTAVISTRPRQRGKKAGTAARSKQQSARAARSLGQASGSQATAGQTVHTSHCFVVRPAATPTRWWYVPVRHRITSRSAEGKKDKKNILSVTARAIRVDPQAHIVLGPKAEKLRRDLRHHRAENPIGKNLFYLRKTRHGFALASPPTVQRFLTGQMLMTALTAFALMPPNALDGTQKAWTDTRPLPPLLMQRSEAPFRIWKEIYSGSQKGVGTRYQILRHHPSARNQSLARKTAESKNPPRARKNAPQANQGARLERLDGRAQTDKAGRPLRTELEFVKRLARGGRLRGRLVLVRKENLCVR